MTTSARSTWRSEETIREALERDAPGIAFFGEEGGGTRGDLWWVVDPLDGTANFLHGFPVVGVSVALVEAGRPVAGAVHAPLLGGETFTAVRGGGAFRDGRPIRVADRPAASAICHTGFPFKIKHRLDEYRRVFEGAFLALEDLRRAGAASLDLAWTAAGVFDGFFEIGLGSWDVAAGALLVTEAGGVVTDWAGDDRPGWPAATSWPPPRPSTRCCSTWPEVQLPGPDAPHRLGRAARTGWGRSCGTRICEAARVL